MFRVAIAALAIAGFIAPATQATAQTYIAESPRERVPYYDQRPNGAEGSVSGQPGGIYAERPIPTPIPVPAPEYLAPTYGGGVIRPSNCGEFRYWNGHRCADARLDPPYVGPR